MATSCYIIIIYTNKTDKSGTVPEQRGSLVCLNILYNKHILVSVQWIWAALTKVYVILTYSTLKLGTEMIRFASDYERI